MTRHSTSSSPRPSESSASAASTPPPGAFDQAARDLERELKDTIRYLNDEVVPKVRVHSSHGLRVAARKLHELAEYLDKQSR